MPLSPKGSDGTLTLEAVRAPWCPQPRSHAAALPPLPFLTQCPGKGHRGSYSGVVFSKRFYIALLEHIVLYKGISHSNM